MKRILSIIAIAALALGASSCAKPDPEFVHDDVTISAIYICTTQKDASGKEKPLKIAGVYTDKEAGTIQFTVPKVNRKEIDLDAVKIRANVGFDAYVKVTKEGGKAVDRTLYGIHDITEGIELTVTAKMTGRTKDYVLTAKVEK
ncbi:MAG: hypothetical protein J6X77_03575 [Bacteroidales bacterium]|nr:hypothetical protein [Bacteroidales bacterium]